MAVPVENLLRRLEELNSHIPDRRITDSLQEIWKEFDRFRPYLNDVERKRDLLQQYEVGNTKMYKNTYRKKKMYKNTSRWVSRIAALATKIEDIMVSYGLHLFNMKTGSLYSKLLYLHFFIINTESISAKIQRYLSEGPQFNTPWLNGFHTQHHNGHLSLKDVPLLIDTIGIDSITSWLKHLLGMDLVELLGQLSKKVTKEVNELMPQDVPMKLVSNTNAKAADYVSKPASVKSIQTILESVNLVGRQEEVRKLEQMLLIEAADQSSPEVIGLTGEPGIGKTTVAAALYKRVQRHFDCHSWVVVSPNSTKISLLLDVLRGILESMSIMAPNNMDSIDEAPLKEMIHRRSTGKKFLLVMDDAPTWGLEYVKGTLPRDCTAKIIYTSRTNSIAYNHVLDLGPLTPENAFNLLQKRACLEHDGSTFWSSVQSEAAIVVSVCNGLPLAIATIGGLLSTKPMERKEWNKVALMLMGAYFFPISYADLRPVLKSCFLYAASFPSHLEISCKKLQRLWIAEDFVQAGPNMTLEEAAKLQLDELIQRNMIQVARVGTDGMVEACRVLRPMQEYALKKCEQDQFCTTLNSVKNTFPEKPHRLFLHPKRSGSSPMTEFDKLNLSGLYSLLLFKGNKQQSLFAASNFKLLSVMELQQLPCDTLQDAIGDLGLLRYLGLRGTKLKKLPSSLKKLHRLQTLDIRDTFVRDLPTGLEGLTMLRHLLLAGSFSDKVVNLNVDIEVFNNLQTVAGVKLTECITMGLIHLPLVHKLSVGEVHSSHSVHLFKSIARMKFLRSFTLKCALGENIDVISCNPHDNLEKLRIGGPVQNMLAWIRKMWALKYLYIWDSMLIEDPFSALQHLPNLVLLSLCNAYNGEEIQFGDRGFLKLKKLSILRCRKLKQWTEIRDGAMGNLQMLTIAYCPRLSGFPSNLEKLPSLQALHLSNMPAQFIKEAKDIHSSMSSSFSLHVQDIAQLSVKVDRSPATKRFPIFKPAHCIEKTEPAENTMGASDKVIDGETVGKFYPKICIPSDLASSDWIIVRAPKK